MNITVPIIIHPQDARDVHVVAGAANRLEEGLGSALSPYVVHDCHGMDAIFRRHREPGTVIRLGRGVFVTAGALAFRQDGLCQLAPGVGLVGAGIDQTILRVVPASFAHHTVEGKTYGEGLWCGAAYQLCRGGNRVEDLTFESTATLPCLSGIRFWGGASVCRRVRVTGVFGSYTEALECFGISSANHPDESDNDGVLWEDCVVVAGRGDYVSAFSCGHTRTSPRRSHLVRCHAQGLPPGTAPAAAVPWGHAAYIVNERVTLRDCVGVGFKHGVYNDTDDATDVVVRDSRFSLSYAGLALINQARTAKYELDVEGCAFGFVGQEGERIAAILWDETGEARQLGRIHLRDCTFDGHGLYAGSVRSPRSGTLMHLERCGFSPGWKAPIHGGTQVAITGAYER